MVQLVCKSDNLLSPLSEVSPRISPIVDQVKIRSKPNDHSIHNFSTVRVNIPAINFNLISSTNKSTLKNNPLKIYLLTFLRLNLSWKL